MDIVDTGQQLARRAAGSTVGTMIAARAKLAPDSIAIESKSGTLTYRQFDDRANRLASHLAALGVARGKRVAILSENRSEYLEVHAAAAKLGAIVACQNWRLAPPELEHCINLVAPQVVVASPRHFGLLDTVKHSAVATIVFGETYEAALAGQSTSTVYCEVDPEDGLFILYTSGTTGLPKGAIVSHRAEFARALLRGYEFGIPLGQSAATWMPFYHMSGTDDAIGTLLGGGKVIVLDGFDPAELAELIGRESIAWLRLMPGMIGRLAIELRERGIKPKPMRLCGTMADLVPRHQIAEITTLLQAPFVNSFGATETGLAPCSSGVIPIGEVPTDLGKTQTSFCELRLVDQEGREVPDGMPGEAAVRGPTLFSGYWNAAETNARDFRGGWFHMGDMFTRRPDGKLDFVDRSKYMIKSGGENIYPAEIERILLKNTRVSDAVVVRRQDDKWGEVPVAFVARKDDGLTREELLAQCRAQLASFKQPKDIFFVPFEKLPRSTTGKIQRHEIEKWIENKTLSEVVIAA
jgi:acyl-CoA synthetase (AMP-forming)/AMP-acid ligase II